MGIKKLNRDIFKYKLPYSFGLKKYGIKSVKITPHKKVIIWDNKYILFFKLLPNTFSINQIVSIDGISAKFFVIN